MKIQIKTIDGEMRGRRENPYNKNGVLYESFHRFEEVEPWHPAIGFKEDEVFEGELVWQFLNRSKMWRPCSDNSPDYAIGKDFTTRQVWLPVEYASQFQPTVEDKTNEQLATEITGACTCDEMYSSRKMTDPQCGWHNYGVHIVDLLDRLGQSKQGSGK